MAGNSGFEDTAGGTGKGADATGRGAHRADKPVDARPEPSGRSAESARDEAEVRGRYVEGSYGKAGVERGRLSEDEEGQFVEGDYGKAGVEGGRPESQGSLAGASGRFVEADYGKAGEAPPRTAESEIGQYAEGDYGKGGRVEPKRKAGTSEG